MVADDDILLLDTMGELNDFYAAADLAYVEVRFSPLGAHWPWHLLLVSALYALAALRFDSRVVWSLALSTFLAWRDDQWASVHQEQSSGWIWSV